VFSVEAQNATSYQWYFNETAISGATNSSLAITKVQNSNVGNYSVTVANSANSQSSANAALLIASVPILANQLQSQTALVGSTVVFSGAAGMDLKSVTTGQLALWLKAGAGVATNTSGAIMQAKPPTPISRSSQRRTC
jgi:predicted ATP-dependent Lon-type protease